MSGGGGGGTQTVEQRADPWGPVQGSLRRAIPDINKMYRKGEYAADPYSGDRVAGFGDATQRAHQMVLDRAGGGAPLIESASGFLSQAMDGNYQSDLLQRVKDNALGSAVPAAVAQFSGSGMTNSTQAMDTTGRAAVEAVAPYEYGAFENSQNRAMTAAGMAPGIEQAGYLPAMMTGQVGAQQDALRQDQINADINRYYETENQDVNNLGGYLSNLMAVGGMGGTTGSTSPTSNPGFLRTAVGGGLGGLGAYGALAANPVTAPYALAGGIGAGLLGFL